MTLKVFAEKDPSETHVLTFDFTADLGTETIQSVTNPCTVTVVGGVDATPATILNGAPAIVTGNLMVQQPVFGGLDFVNYEIRCKVTTTAGNVLVLTGVLPVRYV